MLIVATNRKQIREGIAVLVILSVLVLLEFVGGGKVLRNAGLWIFAPAQAMSARLVYTFKQPYIFSQHVHKSARRVQDLELKYAQTSAELGELDALRAENQALRELLENSDRTLEESVLVTAPILSFSQPTIAAGSTDGVKEGALILSANTLLGIVTEVGDSQSKVALLSQKNTQPILATTELGVQGLVKGDGRRVLLTEIPIDEDIQINERVVTVGQKGVKRGEFIGRVVAVESEHSSSAKVAVLEPFVSFYESVIVEVL